MTTLVSRRGFSQLLGYAAVVDIAAVGRTAAQSWVAYDLTGSNLWVGAVAGIRSVPVLLVPILAGAVIDRYDRRMLIATVLVLQSMLAIVQAVLIGTDTMEPWHQIVLAFVAGSGLAIAAPAFWTFLSEIVEPELIPRANGMVTFVTNMGEMTGPLIVGVIITIAGVHYAFWFTGALYLVAAALIIRIPRHSDGDEPRWKVKTDQLPYLESVREGIAYIRRTPPIPWLFAMVASTNIFGVAVFPLMPQYAVDILDIGGFGFGLMAGSFGTGMAVGSASIAVVGMPRRLALVLFVASVTWDIGMIAFGFSRIVPLTLLILFVMGVVGMYWVNSVLVLFQKAAVEQMRGRVMSIYTMGMGLFPLGWAYGGALASWIGNEPALIISALGGTPLVIAAFAMSPHLRRS